MWSAIPVALLCMVVNRNERQGSGPEGDCRTQGTFVHSFIHPSVRLSAPQALSGLKSFLSGLKSALLGLKSALSDSSPESADFRPERTD